MVKEQAKAFKNNKNPLNYTSDTLMEYPIPKKSKQQINKEYYEKNREERQKQRREKYQQQKAQAPKPKPTSSAPNYSQVSAYKVLISLKKYTELNKEKQKLWLNFVWTFKDLNQTGFHDIIQIMKIREEADKLINDYWYTAKSELKQRSRSWNSLSEEQQNRLVKYWGQEKARWENVLPNLYAEQEERGKKWEKEIKEMMGIALLHEERGRKGCQCWSCKEVKKGKEKLKKELNEAEKEIDDYWGRTSEKVKCPECGRKVKELDEESGVCKSCLRNYQE